MEKSERSKLLVIGAGLPRTGTASLRSALTLLLDGPIYHMYQVFESGRSHVEFWDESLNRPRSVEEWQHFLEGQGFKGGLDHPFCMFYK